MLNSVMTELSSNAFVIECTSKVSCNRTDVTWFLDAVMNDVIDCFGKSFTLHIDTSSFPTVRFHMLFPSVICLRDVALKASAFQEKAKQFINTYVLVMTSEQYADKLDVSYTIVIKDGYIREDYK